MDTTPIDHVMPPGWQPFPGEVEEEKSRIAGSGPCKGDNGKTAQYEGPDGPELSYVDLGADHQEDERVDDESRYLPEVLDREPGRGAHGKPCPLVPDEDPGCNYCHDTGNVKCVFRHDKCSKSQEQGDEHLQNVVVKAFKDKECQITKDQSGEESSDHNLQKEQDGGGNVQGSRGDNADKNAVKHDTGSVVEDRFSLHDHGQAFGDPKLFKKGQHRYGVGWGDHYPNEQSHSHGQSGHALNEVACQEPGDQEPGKG